MLPKSIQLPLSKESVSELRAGDIVLLSGDLFTARDAAHKRLIAEIEVGNNLPVHLVGETIYYVGPAPSSLGQPVGPAGSKR